MPPRHDFPVARQHCFARFGSDLSLFVEVASGVTELQLLQEVRVRQKSLIQLMRDRAEELAG